MNSEIWYKNHFISRMRVKLKFYRLSAATFYDCINTIYQFIKPFLDNKMSIFEEYGAFKPCTETWSHGYSLLVYGKLLVWPIGCFIYLTFNLSGQFLQTTNWGYISYFPQKTGWHFMQMISWMFLRKKNKKNVLKCRLLKFLPSMLSVETFGMMVVLCMLLAL